MNQHVVPPERTPSRAEAEAALDLLRRWAGQAGEEDLRALAPSRAYPHDFRVDDAYRATLPDLQNGPASLIVGAQVPIQHVGISNFRLPLRHRLRDGTEMVLETAVTGTVGLEATAKGINMSRILRSFQAEAEHRTCPDLADAVLDAYARDLGGAGARVLMRAAIPLRVGSLRSGLSGWQYYDAAWELEERQGRRLRMLHLDYVYSSTCPCSLELSEHARAVRGQLAVPHSQRSVARLSVVAAPGLWVEDLIDIARAAVPTETQVMVKREDEQAFAELNAAHPVFVEDAVRAFCAGLEAEPRVGDFRVVASHQESLHSHDAVSVLTRGETFAGPGLEPRLFGTLVRPG